MKKRAPPPPSGVKTLQKNEPIVIQRYCCTKYKNLKMKKILINPLIFDISKTNANSSWSGITTANSFIQSFCPFSWVSFHFLIKRFFLETLCYELSV